MVKCVACGKSLTTLKELNEKCPYLFHSHSVRLYDYASLR